MLPPCFCPVPTLCIVSMLSGSGVRHFILKSCVKLQTLDLKRLVLSALYHADDVHLIYNMLSFLWKGVQLESQLGSKAFALTLGQLLLLSQTSMVAVSKLLATFTPWTAPYNSECAIGFSAVIFALKTVLNSSDPSFSNVAGILLPTRYMAWAELLLIQFLVPNASFVGHLSGILAGLMYLHLPAAAGCAGGAIGAVLLALRLPFSGLRQHWRTRGRFSGRSHITRQDAGVDQYQGSRTGPGETTVARRCEMCTFDNQKALPACEMCGTAWAASGVEDSGIPTGWAGRPDLWAAEPGSSSAVHPRDGDRSVRGDEFLSLDEMRRRRLDRFSR